MAEEKPRRTKIDLKARLGKPASGPSGVPMMSPGGAVPPPDLGGGRSSTPGSIRPGIVPPAGLSPGIPMPPFAQPARSAPPPKPTAQAQTIKVEVGEEVEQERKKNTKKTALAAALTLVLGAAIGFVVGGAKERGDRGQAAVLGAGGLSKDVKAANDKMRELNEKLGEGADQLGKKTYPAELAATLGAIHVPFDATNLEGRQVGGLPGKTLRQLLAYTSAVQELNKSKDSLKNILGAAQAPVEKFWKEQADPPANFSVVFKSELGGKTAAELVPIKEPFAYSKDWPESITIITRQRSPQGVKDVEKKAKRWTKGGLVDSDPIVIPVDPTSVAAFTSEEVVSKLGKALRDIRQIMEGNKDDPRNETAGLLAEGDVLADDLHKASLAK